MNLRPDTSFSDLDSYLALPRLNGFAHSLDGQRLVMVGSALQYIPVLSQ
ncbi:hypothetical protein ACFQDN_08740 [Pseudomonas asuensis]|nr:hypothetical protein [Pseudomonas asuensis]